MPRPAALALAPEPLTAPSPCSPSPYPFRMTIPCGRQRWSAGAHPSWCPGCRSRVLVVVVPFSGRWNNRTCGDEDVSAQPAGGAVRVQPTALC